MKYLGNENARSNVVGARGETYSRKTSAFEETC